MSLATLTHRQIGIGRHLYTLTVGKVKGKERSPEVNRLETDLPQIVATLRAASNP
jgi:hypothetical protein